MNITLSVFTARTRDVTTDVGRSVTLVCNSSVAKPVNWWYKDQFGGDEREVVINGAVVNGNSGRMTMDRYNLIIHNVTTSDSGVYTCVENTGFGEHHKISLTVSGIIAIFIYIVYARKQVSYKETYM